MALASCDTPTHQTHQKSDHSAYEPKQHHNTNVAQCSIYFGHTLGTSRDCGYPPRKLNGAPHCFLSVSHFGFGFCIISWTYLLLSISLRFGILYNYTCVNTTTRENKKAAVGERGGGGVIGYVLGISILEFRMQNLVYRWLVAIGCNAFDCDEGGRRGRGRDELLFFNRTFKCNWDINILQLLYCATCGIIASVSIICYKLSLWFLLVLFILTLYRSKWNPWEGRGKNLDKITKEKKKFF